MDGLTVVRRGGPDRERSVTAACDPADGPGPALAFRPVPSAQTFGADGDSVPSLRQKLNRLVLKPADPAKAGSSQPAAKPSIEELEEDNRWANDKERIIGLLVAPIGALIAFLVIHADIDNDPAQYLKSGAANPKYTSVSVYHEVLLVLLVMCVLLMVAAWFRKRLFMGILAALFGLAVFNLHWWGFGVPFVMVGAWYLVRTYRAQKALKEAKATAGPPGAPMPSKRYTPPTARTKRPEA